MSNNLFKLVNLPWTFSRHELSRHLSRTLDTRVRYAKILFDKQTGLSRGIAYVQVEGDKLWREAARRGSLSIDGRNVLVTRAEGKSEA